MVERPPGLDKEGEIVDYYEMSELIM